MLTPEMARTAPHALVARASAAGADAADALFGAIRRVEVSVRLGELEDVGRSEGEEIGLRVFVGQRSAASRPPICRPTRSPLWSSAPWRWRARRPRINGPASRREDRLLRGALPSSNSTTAPIRRRPRSRKRALAAEDAARAVPGVTNSEGGGACAPRAIFALATSHGFAGGYPTTGYGSRPA